MIGSRKPELARSQVSRARPRQAAQEATDQAASRRARRQPKRGRGKPHRFTQTEVGNLADGAAVTIRDQQICWLEIEMDDALQQSMQQSLQK
jgi:hypothetical protein